MPPLVTVNRSKPKPLPYVNIALLFGGVSGDAANVFPTTAVSRYLFATLAPTAVAPMALPGNRWIAAAVSNTVFAMALGGYGAGGYSASADVYTFASPGTRGSKVSALAVARAYISSASDGSGSAFVFGGYGSAMLDSVELVNMATQTGAVIGAKLSSPAWQTAAAANSSVAFVFGVDSATFRIVDQFQFASTANRGVVPVSLVAPGKTEACAASDGQNHALIFGGLTSSRDQNGNLNQPTATVEHYMFAANGSMGTAAASLSASRYRSTAAGNSSKALVFGGRNTNGGTTVANVEVYLFSAPGATNGTPASFLTATNADGCSATDHQ
jgi:hypothetical protein